jgi:hypothetical protein
MNEPPADSDDDAVDTEAHDQSHGDPRSPIELQAELDRLAAENEKLNSKLRVRSAARSFLTGALVILTSLLLVASTVAVWGKRTVFDTDRFMGVIDPALDDPAFYVSLSRNISDQVIEALDLETRVEARLTQLDEFLAEALVDAIDVPDRVRTALSLVDRPSLADLTPSIVDPLEQRVRDRIVGFITSEDFQTRLPLLARRAHEASIALITGDFAEFPNVYLADGEVRLNLIPIITEALEPVVDTLSGYLPDITLPTVVSDRVGDARQELGAALDVQLPDDFGQLTVMSEDALSSLQTGARRINRATWLLVIVTAVFLVLTVLVAKNRRRTVIWLSLGIITALALSWWIVARIRQAILDKIAMPDSRAAIEALLQETRASFRTYVLVVLVVAAIAGLIAFVVAHLDDIARGGRWARQQVSEPTQLNGWTTAHYDGLRMGGFIVAAIALVWAGIAVVPFLVIGAVLGLYLLALGAMRRDQPGVDSALSET